ncbi:HEAT repeat domain-containing protein [Kitasatospora sp. NPDC059088]|uniref:HEAT repeat domain-containing protein n=1 Tax=Kitasatospora sp. NPDC059088 TaxID=3346722 RepID=UPI0036ABD9AC
MEATGNGLGPRRRALYLQLTELRERAVAARGAERKPHGQKRLQEEVRRTGLPGTEGFNGQIVSYWLPPIQRAELCRVPQDTEVLLGVVAVWSAWAGENSLGPNGRVDERWLRRARPRWDRLLEHCRAERAAARDTRDGETAARRQERSAEAVAAAETYGGRLRERYRRLNLDVLGPSGSAGEQAVIELRQVFVPQHSRPYSAQVPGEWRRLLAAEAVEDDRLPPGVAAEEAERRREAYHAQVVRPVLEVLAGHEGRRLVVLGDPGAGKSTLTQYLALALVGGLHGLPPELAPLDGLVPIVVELRQYAQPQWRERGFEDFLDHTHDLNKMGLTGQVLKDLLTRNRVVMLFDGLDEVFDPGARADIAQRITAFAAAHPGVRTIVTSREYGYRPGDFAPHGFAQVMLQDLDRRQIAEFVPRWYGSAHPAEPELAGRLARRLLGAVRQIRAVAELAGNPLLLTVLASMGLGRTIPRERREVYAHAVQVLIERWDKEAKFLAAPFPAAAEAVTALEWLNVNQRVLLLERIARRMQEGAGQSAGTFIRHKELVSLIVSFVLDGTAGGISRPAAEIAADRLVDQLRTRNFLLAHYGDGVYGFVHRTFLEYLSACDLLRRRTEEEFSRDEIVDLLAGHADDPTWHEVILLTAGGLTKRDAAALLSRLIYLHHTTETGEVAPMLMLAVRVLAEIDDFRSNSTDPRLSVAAQSDAVVDALIALTRRNPFVEVEEALPALANVDRFWTGRQRYLRYYYSRMAFDGGDESGEIVAALSRDRTEALWMVRIPWDAGVRVAALEVLGQRWPDDDDARKVVLDIAAGTIVDPYVRQAALRVLGEWSLEYDDAERIVLDALTDDDSNIRATAVRILGERWSDDDGTRRILRGALTDEDSNVRAAALWVLGERWSGHDDARRIVFEAATGTDPDVRRTALRVLGERWSDHDDARRIVLEATAGDKPRVRWVALQISGLRWSDRDDAWRAVLDAASDKDVDVRQIALRVLGLRWSDRDDARRAVLGAASDTNRHGVRRTALQVLGSRWPDHEDTRQAVLDAASDDEPQVRRAALRVLGERWSDHDGVRRVVLGAAAATDARPDVRWTALRVLGERWFDHDGTWQVVVDALADDDASVRTTALDLLGERWSDHDTTRQVVVDALTHDDPDMRTTALVLLGDRWSDHDTTRQVVLDALTDTAVEVRATALQILASRFGDVAFPVIRQHAEVSQPTGIRVGVAKALALLWPREPETVPTLTALSTHSEEEVRTAARQALNLMTYWSEHLV